MTAENSRHESFGQDGQSVGQEKLEPFKYGLGLLETPA